MLLLKNIPAVLSVNKLSKSASSFKKSLLAIKGINSSSAKTPKKSVLVFINYFLNIYLPFILQKDFNPVFKALEYSWGNICNISGTKNICRRQRYKNR